MIIFCQITALFALMYNVQGLQTLSGKSKLAFLKLYNGHRLTTNGCIEPGEVHNFDGSMIGI